MMFRAKKFLGDQVMQRVFLLKEILVVSVLPKRLQRSIEVQRLTRMNSSS
jgi:hypothetical protein